MAITFKDNSTKEPILTKRLYDLMKWAYLVGYKWGASGANREDCSEEGFVELLNEFFRGADDK